MKCNLIKLSFLFMVFGVISINAQESNLINCWLAEVDREISKPTNCKAREELTNAETLKIIESLLNQKGNKNSHIGVVLRNNVS